MGRVAPRPPHYVPLAPVRPGHCAVSEHRSRHRMLGVTTLSSDDMGHAIEWDVGVTAHKLDSLVLSLSNEQTVERVAVMTRQHFDG